MRKFGGAPRRGMRHDVADDQDGRTGLDLGHQRDQIFQRADSGLRIRTRDLGEHADGRRTYGHSLVVDPWGDVLLDLGGDTPGLGFAEIDPARTAEIRSQLPSLANRRDLPTRA